MINQSNLQDQHLADNFFRKKIKKSLLNDCKRLFFVIKMVNYQKSMILDMFLCCF